MSDQGLAMKSPSHPGGFIRRELIEELGLSVTEGAKILGVTRPTLSQLLNEHVSLSPEMALRVEKAFGISIDTLLGMQNAFDIAEVRRRAGEIQVNRYVPRTPEAAALVRP